MLTNSKKGGATKVIVWIIILLLIVGAVYWGYKYLSKDRSSLSGNNNLPKTSGTGGSGTTQNVNTPTSDTEKPPVPPE